TRSGVSANTSVDCDQVHPSWLGRLSDSGFGHCCTGSYGPKTSCPPLSPGIAANPSPGIFFCCPSTTPSRLSSRMTADKAVHTAAIFSVRPFISLPPRLSNRGRLPAESRATPPSRTHGRLARTVKLRQPYARHIIRVNRGQHRGRRRFLRDAIPHRP